MLDIDPTIFLGPPGTGKTTTLLDTVDQEMVNGVPPDRIGFMTFTKRGVEEAVSRASQRFNLSRSKFRYFNTLHSAAFRHLGLTSNQVFTGKMIFEFGREYGYDLHGALSDDGTYNSFWGDDLILFFENYARITQQPWEQVLAKHDYMVPDTERAYRCVRAFREFKKNKGLYDFTDMLEEFVKIDDPPRLEVLIVDEAQDLSELQWAMVAQLAKFVKRMYIAGDDDQTIFTWAGASERFISMSGQVQSLKQSFRVPTAVHGMANRIISKIVNRRAKIWSPRDEVGSIHLLEGVSQLNPLALRSTDSVMMLGRTVKAIKKKFIPYCRAHGLPYRYFEGQSIKASVARAIHAWNLLHEGKGITPSEIGSIYELLPSEGHNKKPGVAYGYKTKIQNLIQEEDPILITLQELRKSYGLLAQGPWEDVFVQVDRRDVDYIKRVIENGFDITKKPQIHISTIHRVKGGQADTVVLLSDTAKASDKFAASSSDEETRIFYTGLTRTFRDLVIVEPDKKHHFGGLFE